MLQAFTDMDEAETGMLDLPGFAAAGGPALDVTVWGARGSLPASGAAFTEYGGETCAVECRIGSHDGHALVIDAGSGLVPMGRSLVDRGVREIDLVLSHLHYDHVMGLPFFAPAHRDDVRLRIHYGGHPEAPETGEGVEAVLADYFRAPFFPVGPGCFRADVSFHALPSGPLTLAAGAASVVHAPLTHPGGAVGYRVEREGTAFAYVTDFEQDGGAGDDSVIALAANADVALMDATYTPDDYAPCAGYGHAHWRAAGELAVRAGARSWGLFHHHHERDDAALARIEREAGEAFPGAFAARTGQRFALGRAARAG